MSLLEVSSTMSLLGVSSIPVQGVRLVLYVLDEHKHSDWMHTCEKMGIWLIVSVDILNLVKLFGSVRECIQMAHMWDWRVDPKQMQSIHPAWVDDRFRHIHRARLGCIFASAQADNDTLLYEFIWINRYEQPNTPIRPNEAFFDDMFLFESGCSSRWLVDYALWLRKMLHHLF